MELKVLPSEKVQLYLLFYKPSNDDPALNRIVAFFDYPFCHVEIAIPNRTGDAPRDRTMLASSIYQNQTVFFKPKTYDREGYISFGIEISVAQLYRIKSFCKHHTERKTPFCLHAMYAAYLPFQLIETDATFCSKHVTQALQYARVPLADGINPALTTPSRLYKRLVGASPIVQIVPSRMMTLSNAILTDNNNNNNNTNKMRLKGRECTANFVLNVANEEKKGTLLESNTSYCNNTESLDEEAVENFKFFCDNSKSRLKLNFLTKTKKNNNSMNAITSTVAKGYTNNNNNNNIDSDIISYSSLSTNYKKPNPSAAATIYANEKSSLNTGAVAVNIPFFIKKSNNNDSANAYIKFPFVV